MLLIQKYRLCLSRRTRLTMNQNPSKYLHQSLPQVRENQCLNKNRPTRNREHPFYHHPKWKRFPISKSKREKWCFLLIGEQVGSLPQNFSRNDVQITTEPGDIVLYSGNQLVIFFGSNSWSYTKLGHIEGLSEQELSELLDTDSAVIEIKTN